MSDLPKYIVLILCKESSKANKNILKIFKDYFSGVPHITYTDCNLDSNNIYYIFTAEHLVETIIRTDYGGLDISVILGCDIYIYMNIYI